MAPPLEDPSALRALAAELEATPYVPKRFLARGGMGSLVEVEHAGLKRPLAMKLLLEHGRPDLEDRLRVEAHALARLSHPNVLGVIDFQKTSKGRPFFVAELLEGHTLREHLDGRGALPPAEAADLAIQALRGLGAAHEIGIVHRDVKLENLFVCATRDGSPLLKVLDFGIAKIIETEPGRGLAVAPPMVPTEEGSLMGTPSNMSPEQITSARVDHRADLYGVGVVLFRMLTGRHPFPSDSALDYARAHATEPPPRPSTWADLPPGLEEVVLRALEKRPADRYANAAEMIRALAPFVTATAPRPAEAASSPPVLDPDSLPTLPIVRPRSPAAIAGAPVFAPAPPPRSPAPTSPAPRDEAPSEPRTALGTIITSRSIVAPHRDDTATRFVPSLDPTPPAETRRPTRPPRALELGRLAPAESREGPTLRARRLRGPQKSDRSLALASILVVVIALGAAAYVALLVANAR